MKTGKFFTSLINLDSDIRRFEIEKGLYITSSLELKNIVIRNSLPAIGGLEYNSIIDNKVLAFAFFPDNINDKNKYTELRNFLFFIDNFITALWLIKDNSIYKELGYLSYNDDKQFYSNFIAQINSNYKGKKEVTKYSVSELKKSLEYYNKINTLMTNDNNFNYSELTPESDRLARAFYFINGARLLPDIGIKYTLYCTCLEALFITNTKNITRSLAERVEIIMNNRIPNVKSYIYKAYEYRSKIIHGKTFNESTLKKEEKLLKNISILDEICRITFKSILDSSILKKIFKSGTNEIEKYFKENYG